jgi:phage tail sheath protein FI
MGRYAMDKTLEISEELVKAAREMTGKRTIALLSSRSCGVFWKVDANTRICSIWWARSNSTRASIPRR